MPLDVMLEDFDIVIEDDRWEAVDLEPLAHAAAQATLGHLGLDAETAEMTLLACDDTRIAALNEDFRGKARATNVLSWPAEERVPPHRAAIRCPPSPALTECSNWATSLWPMRLAPPKPKRRASLWPHM